MAHEGFGRPENIRTPAVQESSSLELDVPIHNDHETAEIRVAAAIARAWICDHFAAVVEIGHRIAAGLMRPEAVIPQAVAVKIPVRPDHNRNEIALARTLQAGARIGRIIYERITEHRWLDTWAGDRTRRRAAGSTGLSVGIRPVVARIVVAIVVELTGASGRSIVPPSGFVYRRTRAFQQLHGPRVGSGR